jgi:hypothetical protein
VPVLGGKAEVLLPFSGYTVGSFDGRIIFGLPAPINQSRREGRLTYATASGARGELVLPRGSYLGNNLGSSERSLAVTYTREEWAHHINLTDGKLRVLRPGSVSSRGPTWSSDGRQVALHDSTDGAYGITVMRPDGSGARHYPVSAFPDFMQWSPNGKVIAYSPEPGFGGAREIGLLDLATGETRIVSSSPGAQLLHYRWRPDGTSLVVFKWFPGIGNGPLVRQLFEASLSGRERILRDISVEFPELTQGGPVSARFVALGAGQSWGQAYLLSPDGGPLLKLPPMRLAGFTGEPGLSRDGRWLAWLARNTAGKGTLVYIVSTRGDSLRTLPIPFDVDPASFKIPFTPDGKHLILYGKLPGENVSKIFSVPLDGSAPRALATLPASSRVAGRLDLSPDGSAVVFTSVGQWTSKISEIDVTPILQAVGYR